MCDKPTKRKLPLLSQELENLYLKQKLLKQEQVINIAKRLDLSEREINRWWRIRRVQDTSNILDKFCESSWRCLYYTFSFCFGLWTLWNKAWLWDIDQCIIGYPHQVLDDEIWWYYMISLGFYLSLLFTQFQDVKRKDFWQMFIHHIVAILLLVCSWICSYYRVGSLILIIHDVSDIFLEGAKVLKYVKMIKAATFMFILLLVSWVVARLGVFSRIVYWCTTTYIKEAFIFPTINKLLHIFLAVLLLLHFGWTILLLQSVKRVLVDNKDLNDARSSSEVSNCSDCDTREG